MIASDHESFQRRIEFLVRYATIVLSIPYAPCALGQRLRAVSGLKAISAISALAMGAFMAFACSSTSVPRLSSSPTAAVTSRPVPAVTVESIASAEPTPASAPPVSPVCPDPNVTPIASNEPSDTPVADSADATAAPIRIAHPVSVTPAPSATPAGSPEPTSPAQHEDAELEGLIRAQLGVEAPHYAIVMEDLEDGRSVEIDPDRVFYAASLFKLEVMYAIFAQRDAGILDLAEQYIACDYYRLFGLGPRGIEDCARANVGDLLAAMMSVSDNVAAVMLQDRAGAANVNSAMASLGLQRTRLTEDDSLPATAGDLARLVEAITRRDALSSDARYRMIALMETEELNDRIPKYLLPGIGVAHKTGNWDNATHDAGIVYGTKGTYVMVLMSDLGFGTNAGSVEANVAKIAVDYFER